MMLHGPIPYPGMERRRRVTRTLVILVAIVVVGYLLGAMARPDAVEPAINSRGEDIFGRHDHREAAGVNMARALELRDAALGLARTKSTWVPPC